MTYRRHILYAQVVVACDFLVTRPKSGRDKMNPSGGKACPEGSRRIRIGAIAILSAAGFGISVYAAARVAVAPRIGAPSASKVESHQPAPRINFAKLPMRFEPNLGQSDPRVKFLARAGLHIVPDRGRGGAVDAGAFRWLAAGFSFVIPTEGCRREESRIRDFSLRSK